MSETDDYGSTVNEYLTKIRNDSGPGIIRPLFKENITFKFWGQCIDELKENIFYGKQTDDPHEHISNITGIIDLFHSLRVVSDQVMLMDFPFTLKGKVKQWMKRLSAGSITTWKLLKQAFLEEYCPPLKIIKQIESIRNFKQELNEPLHCLWKRFTESLFSCPEHKLNKHEQLQIFYQGLDIKTRLKVNFKGPIAQMTPTKGMEAIKELSAHSFMDLLARKGKTKETSKITLNERCSTILLNQIPFKEKDPGSFTILCVIGKMGIDKALADLGASISLMPYTMYARLDLGELKPTRICIELANKSTQYPKGIADNVIVKIDKFIFPVDFLVLDMKEDHKDAKFIFSNECMQAFNIIKNKLTSSPIIIASDWNLDFELMCDASDYAVGAVLGQCIDKKFCAIYYANIKYYIWDDPYIFKSCPDGIIRRCVFGKELLESLEHCHTGPTGGHYEADITARKVFKYGFYWPTIFRDVARYIRDCDACQRAGNISSRNQMPLTNIIVSEVFDIWGINFMGPFPSSRNNKYILVAVGYVSKWVEAEALSTNDARVVVKFLQKLFLRFGVPKALISDHGTHFCNSILENTLKKYGVTHRLATPYHPKISGQTENTNRAIKRILERTVNGNRKEWADKLDDTLWEFRNAYKSPIKSTPFKIIYGKACHLPIEMENKAYWALKIVNLDLDTAGKHRRRGLVFNSRLKLFPGKLKSRWYGPYTISKVFPYGTVKVCGSLLKEMEFEVPLTRVRVVVKFCLGVTTLVTP
ncbi:reverse transcriptase domain-containing protein [Tanacetum coccineum]